MSHSTAALLEALGTALGAGGIVAGDRISDRYCADATRLNPCPPLAVVRPRSTAEVAAVLRLCHAAVQPVVVQGGLTGLAGGATPRTGEISLSLER